MADHYRAVCPEWHQAGIPYLEWCSGFNPIIHWPQAKPRDLDFFMVAGYEPDRVRVAADYLEPIFSHHFGLWAGPRWSFGAVLVDPQRTRALYARARVANPLHRALVASAMDISQRTFAAAGCGAFVLTDRTPATERFFATDENLRHDGAWRVSGGFRTLRGSAGGRRQQSVTADRASDAPTASYATGVPRLWVISATTAAPSKCESRAPQSARM